MVDKHSAVELYLSHDVSCNVLSVTLDSVLVGRAHCDRDVTKEARFSRTPSSPGNGVPNSQT